MSETKNIGQVVGLYIGNTEPTNTALIWYDNTPSCLYHKVYNPSTKSWQALNPDIISTTTYSELVNIANKNGLSIGKKYVIRDKANILATVITPTKIQYVDNSGNILIDDLGTNIQYHVSGNNILIDDINGVLDVETNKLKFSFVEATPNFNTDYLLGKVRSGKEWILAKFNLKKLLSDNSQNSLKWNSGIFFNFTSAIKNILDKKGGIVSKDSYDLKIKELTQSINTVSQTNQTIISGASDAVTNATKDESIYEKKLPINIDVATSPTDIQKGDTLSIIVSKIQRWINKFKYATGVQLSKNFSDAKGGQYINSNDTVESALSKIQYHLKHTNSLLKLQDDWKPKDKTKDIEFPKPGDSFDEAFAKAVGKLTQLGEIYNGGLRSVKEFNHLDDVTRKACDLNLEDGTLNLAIKNNYYSRLAGGSLKISKIHSSSADGVESIDVRSDRIKLEAFDFVNHSTLDGANEFSTSPVLIHVNRNLSLDSTTTPRAAITGINDYEERLDFDAIFPRLRCNELSLTPVYMTEGDTYAVKRSSLIIPVIYKSASGRPNISSYDIFLPNNPYHGMIVIIIPAIEGDIMVGGDLGGSYPTPNINILPTISEKISGIQFNGKIFDSITNYKSTDALILIYLGISEDSGNMWRVVNSSKL